MGALLVSLTHLVNHDHRKTGVKLELFYQKHILVEAKNIPKILLSTKSKIQR